jgi:hypothetical protein
MVGFMARKHAWPTPSSADGLCLGRVADEPSAVHNRTRYPGGKPPPGGAPFKLTVVPSSLVDRSHHARKS